MNDNINLSKALIVKDNRQLEISNRAIQISEKALISANKEEVILFCKRHKDFFNKISSEYFAHTEETISKAADLLDWSLLSRNENVKWSANLICRYAGKWNWNLLSSNPSIPWDVELLRKFQGRLNWHLIKSSPFLQWTESIIDEFCNFMFYKDPSNFGRFKDSISSNSKLPWSISLIDKYLNKWDWDGLSGNPGLPWSKELFDRYTERWNWYWISRNTGIPWTLGLIERYSDRLIFNPDENKYSNYGANISDNPSLPWSIDLIQKYGSRWSWFDLSNNKKLPWDEDLIEKYKDKWNWEMLSRNWSIKWNTDLIRKYKSKVSFEYLSENANTVWSEELINEFHDYWNWDLLCANKGLPWSEKLIQKHKNLWNWQGRIDTLFGYSHCLSNNPKLPWSHEFIKKYCDKIDWKALSRNKGVNWSVNLLDRYWNKYDLDKLSQNGTVWIKAFAKYINDDIVYELSKNEQSNNTENNIDPSLSLDLLKKLLLESDEKRDRKKTIIICDIILSKYGNINIRNAFGPVISYKAIAYYFLRDYHNALNNFNILVEDKHGIFYLIWRSRCYQRIGDLNLAIKDVNELIKKCPNDTSAYRERGQIYLTKHEYEKAIDDFTRSGDFSNRAKAYEEMGLADKAIEDYSTILQNKPDDYSAFKNKVRLFEKKVLIDNAVEEITKFIKIQPENLDLYYQRSGLYIKNDNFEKAIEDYSRLIANEPNFEISYYYYYNRAKAQFAIGNWEKALLDLNMVYENIDKIADDEKDETTNYVITLYAAIYTEAEETIRKKAIFKKLIDTDGFLEELKGYQNGGLERGNKTIQRFRYDSIY
jgi:tetratricopeptide (TPR) repeat protein